ncbi:tripartite motif-containing protein 2-like [Mytilus trossulus]|uniref:tripartite motif-containing protein 2-like n=1 Tax=Mytilus trossulus TaxID=6551 RepID=UPI00300522E0
MATSASTPCDVCAGQSISKQAVKWCPECEEAYCSECIKHHGIAKATKDHSVIAVDNYLKLPPFVLETKHHCTKHGSRFQNYCRSHETPCCKRCIDTDHKKCSDLPALDDIIHDAKSSVAFADIEERLQSLKKFFSEVITEKEENLNKLKVKRETIEKQIRKIRKDINQHLDNLEKEILHKIFNQENHHQRNIEITSKQMKIQSSRINSLLENMEPIKQYASNLQTFLSTKEIDKELYKTEKEVEVLCEDGSLKRYDISFIKDDKLGNFMEGLKSFGKISSTGQPTEIVYAKSKVKQAQIVAVPCKHVLNINLVLEKKVMVPRPGDGMAGLVTGCVILQNKNFLFSFRGLNISCLSLLDEHGGKIFVLTREHIGFQFSGIAVINDTTVAITSDMPSKSIAIFNTETRKVSKVIVTKQLCSGGISCFENTLIYSCGEEGLEMISLDTGNICSLKSGSHASDEYVTVFKNKIYSTDSSSDTVTCYDMDGKIHWKWQNHDEIKSMRGVAVDNNSNVYVAGVQSGRIAIISPDGKVFKSFKPEGIEKPRAIYYDKKTNKLLISENCGNAGLYSVY